MDTAQIALKAVNHISAMVAYWDSNQRCRFSNEAYREWFGRDPQEMLGISMQDLLGPLYEKNLPHILAVLKGEKQVFERQIPIPGGAIRESIATYTPDVVDGVVRGFWVHVADVTTLRERESALIRTVQERDAALAEIQTLRGLLPICAGCKSIRDAAGEWKSMEEYLSQRTDVSFTHGICPNCLAKYQKDIK